MVNFGAKEQEEIEQKLATRQLRRWMTELWSYAVVMAVFLAGTSVLLTGDILLAVPIVGVCLVVGCVGTLLAVLRYKKKDDGVDPPYGGIFWTRRL